MIRTLVAFGIVLLEAPLAQADPATSYRFDGHLVYRSSDGTLIPLFPDAVFVGWGDDGCEIEHQSSERLNFYPDGVFQLTVFEMVTTFHRFEDGSPARPGSAKVDADIVRWPCYRFRVEGCDDGIVKFGPTPPTTSIELTCPGRESGPKREIQERSVAGNTR